MCILPTRLPNYFFIVFLIFFANTRFDTHAYVYSHSCEYAHAYMIFFLTPILSALCLIASMFFASTRYSISACAYSHSCEHAHVYFIIIFCFPYSYYTSYSTYAMSTWCFEDEVSNACDIPSVELCAELNRMTFPDIHVGLTA